MPTNLRDTYKFMALGIWCCLLILLLAACSTQEEETTPAPPPPSPGPGPDESTTASASGLETTTAGLSVLEADPVLPPEPEVGSTEVQYFEQYASPDDEDNVAEPEYEIHNDYNIDGNIASELCANSTHVFYAENRDNAHGHTPVFSDTGERLIKQRQHKMWVRQQVKGTLDGTNTNGTATPQNEGPFPIVIVNQQGGNFVAGEPITPVEGDEIMVTGEKYMILANWSAANGWHEISVQPQGNRRIDSSAERDKQLARWTTACGETPPSPANAVVGQEDPAGAQYQPEVAPPEA